MLYNEQFAPEIQVDINVQNEVSESESLPVERSLSKGVQITTVQKLDVPGPDEKFCLC